MNDQATELHDIKVRTATNDVFVFRSVHKQPRDARGRFIATLIDAHSVQKEIDYNTTIDGSLVTVNANDKDFDVISIEPDDAEVTGTFSVGIFARMKNALRFNGSASAQEGELLLDQPIADNEIPATPKGQEDFDLRLNVGGQDSIGQEHLYEHSDGTLSSEPEIIKESPSASKLLEQIKKVVNKLASSPVGDIAYILCQTDDIKVTSNKIKSFFGRKQDADENDMADAEQSKPSLLSRAGNVVKNLPKSVPQAAKTIFKEWKTIGATAAIVGGTRWGLTALAGMAGAPVLASLAVITGTCGVVAGSLRTRHAWKKEKQRLLALDARQATTSFSNPEQIATTKLSFREFMEQNKGLLSSNIAKGIAAASVGSVIGGFAHHTPDFLKNVSKSVTDLLETDGVVDNTPPVSADAPAAPVVDFAAVPLAQKLEMVRGSIQGEPSAYITNRLTEAAQGKGQAMKDVARALLAGEHGLAVDKSRAVALYEQAAAAGNEQAIRDLAYIKSLPEQTVEAAPKVETAPQAQADQAPQARAIPRVAPSHIPAPVASQHRGLSDSFLEGLQTEDEAPTGNSDLLPVVTPETVVGYNVSGFDPSGNSMARCFNMSETCEAAQDRVAQGNESVRFQDGRTFIDVPMNPGETHQGFLARQFANWSGIREQLNEKARSLLASRTLANDNTGGSTTAFAALGMN